MNSASDSPRHFRLHYTFAFCRSILLFFIIFPHVRRYYSLYYAAHREEIVFELPHCKWNTRRNRHTYVVVRTTIFCYLQFICSPDLVAHMQTDYVQWVGESVNRIRRNRRLSPLSYYYI